jgi:hypothetical protein
MAFFLFLANGDSSQGYTLARQVLYHLNHTSSLFALIIFQVESTIFAQGWPGP